MDVDARPARASFRRWPRSNRRGPEGRPLSAPLPGGRSWVSPLAALLVVAPILAFLLLLPGQARAATITPNTTADELDSDGNCSLREAIQAANTDSAVDACTAGSGADTIDVPAGTYALAIAGAGEDANATGDLDILPSVLTIGGARLVLR